MHATIYESGATFLYIGTRNADAIVVRNDFVADANLVNKGLGSSTLNGAMQWMRNV